MQSQRQCLRQSLCLWRSLLLRQRTRPSRAVPSRALPRRASGAMRSSQQQRQSQWQHPRQRQCQCPSERQSECQVALQCVAERRCGATPCRRGVA